MSMINIDELHKKRLEKINRKNEIYELNQKNDSVELMISNKSDLCF